MQGQILAEPLSRFSLNEIRTHHDFLSARNANDHTHIFQPQKVLSAYQFALLDVDQHFVS